MNRSSKVKSILRNKENLWDDSETDVSSTSDTENRKISTRKVSFTDFDTSEDEDSDASTTSCCLICSILPNLSAINTCQQHLTLLTKPRISRKMICAMPPKISPSQSKLKNRYRFNSSSSSSSSESRHPRKRRSMILTSSDSSSQSDLFFSPNSQSQEPTNNNNQGHRLNSVQDQLSPSLPPSSTMNKNMNSTLQQSNEHLSSSFLQRNNSKNKNQKRSILKNVQNTSIQRKLPQISHDTNSPDVIELDSNLSSFSSNSHNQNKEMTDMDQSIEEIFDDEYPQPIILLTRVHLEE